MREKKIFIFSGKLESVQFNLTTTAVLIPHRMSVDFPKGRLKVIGLMNGAPFSLPIQYRKQTGRFFPVSAALRQSARVNVGDTVNICFRLIDEDRVEFPEVLENVVEGYDKSDKTWNKSINGGKRFLESYLSSAKQMDSRLKKSIEVVQKSKAALPATQVPRKKKNS